MGLEKFDKFLRLCWVCGACYGRGPTIPHNWREINPNPSPSSRCPSYEYFKFRTYTAMDRNSLATLVLREAYPITEDLKKVFHSCVLCGVCREICGILDLLEINLAAREEFFEKSGPLDQYKGQLESLSIFDNPLDIQEEKSKWIKDLDVKSMRESESDTLFYVGCNYSLVPSLLEKTRASASILKMAGINFGILGKEEKCCRIFLKIIGDSQGYIERCEENRRLFNKLKIRRIVTMCPSCLIGLKPSLNGAGIEIFHITELISRLMNKLKMRNSARKDIAVTYHDPCDLGRKSKIYDAPREILKKLPGVELIEMERNKEWAYCCGGGGGCASLFPEFVDFTSGKRIEEAYKTGAEILVTSCPTCNRVLRKSARQHKLILVKDLLEFVCEFIERA